MNRFASLEVSTSNDIVLTNTPNVIPIKEYAKQQEKEWASQSGECSTKIDLNNFIQFDHETAYESYHKRNADIISITKCGKISVTAVENLKKDEKIQLRLNKTGTILVVVKHEKGLRVGINKNKKVITCSKIAGKLEEIGIPLPARYECDLNTKDTDGQAIWVGRLKE